MASKLIPITVTAPGTRGLNLQEVHALQGPEWCRTADNLEIDGTGRLSTRDGWVRSHATAISGTPDVKQTFEYKPSTGANVEIFCADNKLWRDRTSPTDITGSLTITADNWKFQNFNGHMVGYQAGHAPIIWKGSGNFTLLSAEAASAGLVQSNEVLAAWGRTWVVDPADNSTIWFSTLLVPQDFSVTGSSNGGSVDMKSVWTKGQDRIIALAAFNNSLIIFGKETTTVYQHADDPFSLNSSFELTEVVYDIGCVARDSVQYIDEDLFFLSRTGVRSYKRTILRDKQPQADITKNVRDDVIQKVLIDDVDDVRSVYDKVRGQYLITFPASMLLYCIDVKKYVSTGEVRIFSWNGIEPLALHSLENGNVLAGFAGGFVGLLDGTADNDVGFISKFEAGHTDLATLFSDQTLAARLIMLKKYEAQLQATSNVSPSLSWSFDQNDIGSSRQISFTAGAGEEYNIAEYNIAEYGGGSTSTRFSVNTSGSGRTFSFGVTIAINGAKVSYQYANLMFKIGRIT